MNKVIRNGRVAVLYSPGFGAGWSTWNSDDLRERLCMDSQLVSLVESGNLRGAAELASTWADYVCVLGAEQLAIEWVPQGSSFEIEEFDGRESVHVLGTREYLTA